MKMLETIHILPVRAESAAPAPLRPRRCAAKSSTSAPCCKSSARSTGKRPASSPAA